MSPGRPVMFRKIERAGGRRGRILSMDSRPLSPKGDKPEAKDLTSKAKVPSLLDKEQFSKILELRPKLSQGNPTEHKRNFKGLSKKLASRMANLLKGFN